MAETIKSAINYKGFVLHEMAIEVNGMVAANPPTSSTVRQWRISSIDARPYQYITARTREEAERKINSGEAKRELDRLANNSSPAGKN